jgi:hypothetical protein
LRGGILLTHVIQQGIHALDQAVTVLGSCNARVIAARHSKHGIAVSL